MLGRGYGGGEEEVVGGTGGGEGKGEWRRRGGTGEGGVGGDILVHTINESDQLVPDHSPSGPLRH